MPRSSTRLTFDSADVATTPGYQLFSPGWDEESQGFSLYDPIQILTAIRIDDVVPVLEEAVARANEGHIVAGFVAYEAGNAFEPSLPLRTPGTPFVWFGVYPAESALRWPSAGDFAVDRARFALTRASYQVAFEEIKKAIREGDVYQVNFTAPVDFDFCGDALALYQALSATQPVPFGAFIDTGEMRIVSRSPELFFRRCGDVIVTRPMKGTIRRGAGEREDAILEAQLESDSKSRAENLMIVDLLRNDLSRCCRPGTVKVARLFTTERYRTVIQMTSEIEGRLAPGAGLVDVFRALFPCGSVTGAPKISAMRQIHTLEDVPRGVYCGAIGFMQRDRAVFNVAIRTVVLRGSNGRLGVGGGVVWDSNADDEYDECLLKARFLTDVIPDDVLLIETMRSEGGSIKLLELHVDRLRKSARDLGFAFDEEAYRARVAAALSQKVSGNARNSSSHTAAHKVRTTLSRHGSVHVDVIELQDNHDRWEAVLSEHRIDSEDPYRRHKTTRRALYNDEYRRAVDAGFDEVIFLNERDEIAEGSRTNVVAVIAGEWRTPPVESGALPGVYRRHLLETVPNIRVCELSARDLREADEIYLCNAVNGCVPAHFILASEKIREDVT